MGGELNKMLLRLSYVLAVWSWSILMCIKKFSTGSEVL